MPHMADSKVATNAARAPSRPFPNIALKHALRIPQAISDAHGGKPMPRLLVAGALKLSPGSSQFRDLIAGSAKYGLTAGNFTSETIALTEVGRSITRPRSEGERLEALRAAFRSIPLFASLITHFNNSKLPNEEFLTATLERSFSVDPSWSRDAAKVFIETARYVGIVRDISGSPYVMADAGAATSEDTRPERNEDDTTALRQNGDDTAESLADAVSPPQSQTPLAPPKKLQFFVAHGTDREALAQLQSMLKDLGIPYVVAVDEAHAGRPISQKVADLMKESSGGLFIFSADEEVTTVDGKTEKRPRMNVVFELGAASLQYGKRIVIFKEHDVALPSDFSDLGHIEYKKGELRSKSLDLLKELIKLGAVQLLPGA
jgi:predicted nucleotide-binding protein